LSLPLNGKLCSTVWILCFLFTKKLLPALEVAAAPMMKPAGVLQEADAEGQLSLNVVRAVASHVPKTRGIYEDVLELHQVCIPLIFIYSAMLMVLSNFRQFFISVLNTGRLIVHHLARKVLPSALSYFKVRPNSSDLA